MWIHEGGGKYMCGRTYDIDVYRHDGSDKRRVIVTNFDNPAWQPIEHVLNVARSYQGAYTLGMQLAELVDTQMDIDKAWDWVLSRDRFQDASGSYAWIWEGMSDEDLASYDSYSLCETVLATVHAREIFGRLAAKYTEKDWDEWPLLSEEHFKEFLARSDYRRAVDALADQVALAKERLENPDKS